MYQDNGSVNLTRLLRRLPDAVAYVKGNEQHSHLSGVVEFYETAEGVVVIAELNGLPVAGGPCGNDIFAFHIHEGGSCSGEGDGGFPDTGGHYNPTGCPHPYHAGDMPPLFSVRGRAHLSFLTGRFTAGEIIGRSVVVHSAPDDFTTQPAGNAGEKIACGEILGIRR